MQKFTPMATHRQLGNSMSNILQQMRLNVAKAALEYITENQVVGIGTGNTINIFIEQLATIKHKINAAVASSEATASLLKAHNIPIVDLNSLDELPLYIDSADAYNNLKQLVKGGGGALTREKILAVASKKFICIVDANKKPGALGDTPIPIEVIPTARSLVARKLVKLGGQPQYRANYITDNGNIILDVYGLQITEPVAFEQQIKQITGVVDSGIFAVRAADHILIGDERSVSTM